MGYKPGSSGGGGGSAVTGETITAATVSGSGTVISKNKTISKPTIPANVYLALPSASAAVAYQDYQIKDGLGNADVKKITITTESGSIDGVAEDVIDARWGSKTYYTDGVKWFVRDKTTKVLGGLSGGDFSYAQTFPGADADPLPTGWSSTRTGTGWHATTSEWTVQGGVYPGSSANTSSAGAHNSLSAGGAWYVFSTNGTQTLTYTTETIASGSVVSFKWMKDMKQNTLHNLVFKVNGSTVDQCPSAGVGVGGSWSTSNYTIPGDGSYTLEWIWSTTDAHCWDGHLYNHGVFIDEFTIT